LLPRRSGWERWLGDVESDMKRSTMVVVAAGLALTPVTSLLARVGTDDKGMATTKAPAAGALDMNAKLPSDDRLVTGELDNGMKYIILKHSNPPGRATMWIHVSSGSLNETDKQRGIAHYLEHMAFNGSANFPPGTVTDFFQSMGLTFGQHQNAFTSFDQTTYQLAFPDVQPETLERGMKFFGDVATRLSLLPTEIDKERQIILEEKRSRSSAAQRMQDIVLKRLAPGSLVGERLPIGTEETLMGVSEPDFKEYYGKWYVPSNMTVIVVADADTKLVVDQIVKSFSGGEKKAKPVDQDAKVTPYTTTQGVVVHDPEQTNAELEIVRIDKPLPPTTTVGDMRRDLVQQLGTSAFSRRIGAKLAKGGTSYLSANANTQSLFNAMTYSSIGCEGEPGKWKDMLKEVGAEVQRARIHGFTQREIDDVKTAMLSNAEQFVKQEGSMPARMVINRLNRNVAAGDTIMNATQELELLKKLLPTITPDEASKQFAKDFDTTNVTFVAQLPSNLSGGLPTEPELVTIGRAALDVKPEKEAEAERPTSLLAKVPMPGKVVDVVDHAASGVTSAWLDNGIRVHHKFMDIRKDQATISIAVAGGQIQETAKNRGISDVAGLAWNRPATSTLSSTNIRDLMTGKKVRVGGGAGMDTLNLTVSGSPSELETGMQLAYLMLTDPVIEQAAFDQWKTNQIQDIADRKKNPQGVFGEAMLATVYPASEVRVQPLTVEQVNALSLGEAQKWLRNTLSTAPIEVTVVGDIQKDEAMKLVSTYLGSLSKRDKMTDKTLDDLRSITRAKGPIVTERSIETKTPMALAAVGFYACDADNVKDRRSLQMASVVLNTRINKKVREEEQLAYSPGCRVSPAREFPGFGTFAALSPTAPEKLDALVKSFTEVYDEFAKTGPTEEEMVTARKQLANTLDEQMKDPSFWVTTTGQMEYRATKLDDVMAANDFYQSLSADQVKSVFNKYYTPEATMRVVIRPIVAAGSSEKTAPAKN
jgi:zinc protease